MDNQVVKAILAVTALSREQLESFAEELVGAFPERADQISFLLHCEFSEKYLGAVHRTNGAV